MKIDGINLTKMTDAKLMAIVAKLTTDAAVKAQYEFLSESWNTVGIKGRPAVRNAANAIEAWKHVNTETTVCEPSPESKQWSDTEGGHRFHQVPTFRG